MQVFISSGPDWHAINDENYDDFSGMGYKPLLWYGGNVYVGNDFQTHDLLCKEFGIKWGDWDDRPDEGMLFNSGTGHQRQIEWRGLSDGPAPGVNDAILEALGVPNTFMSKQAGWNDVMQWPLDWASEKGLDADAAIHSRIHPEGCEDEECWICHDGQRPKKFNVE